MYNTATIQTPYYPSRVPSVIYVDGVAVMGSSFVLDVVRRSVGR